VPWPIATRADESPSTEDNGLLASQVNGLYRAAPNAYGAHGLYVAVAGWSFVYNTFRFWPGYYPSTPLVPNPASVDVPANPFILDASDNALEPTAAPYAKGNVQYAVVGLGWDTIAPTVAESLVAGYYDIIPLGASDIDHFELQFSEGMRDSSFYYRDGATSGIATGLLGWDFRNAEGGDTYRYGSTGFTTQVTSSAFGAANVPDDRLLGMDPVPLNPVWTARSQMLFRYDAATGRITDLAGNLLQGYTDGPCAEKQPPRIRFASAEVGTNRLYLQFSEPVWHNTGIVLNRSFVPGDFLASGLSAAITSVTPFGSSGAVSEVWLDFDSALTTADALAGRLALAATVVDRANNPAEPAVVRRAVDIATGVINVRGASDGVHRGDPTTAEGALGAGALGLLRTFDGTGRLYDMDTTIYTTVDLSGGVPPSTSLSLFYDVAPSADYEPTISITDRSADLGAFWLPSYLSGFNVRGNDEARRVLPFSIGADGVARNFLIPSADPEIESGAEVGFLMRMGDLWLARGASAGDPRQFDLWSYRVQDIIKQRGGVTILNNVIDVKKGERVAVQVDVANGGQVSVMVFTLDGDVVRSLHRGRLAAGTYTMTWDGTNAGGSPVARGMYFIRVVGPGLDEVRKVMVVKD